MAADSEVKEELKFSRKPQTSTMQTGKQVRNKTVSVCGTIERVAE